IYPEETDFKLELLFHNVFFTPFHFPPRRKGLFAAPSPLRESLPRFGGGWDGGNIEIKRFN
ncbi:MAG TPA: hypothetical protein VFB97_05105, partial [Bacteroidales bacterium]|nr:hypothetical protein [Bacteroidales bacterium]